MSPSRRPGGIPSRPVVARYSIEIAGPPTPVVHESHAFGFDSRMLSCIDLADGKRKWKGGRYGHGQLVLLPEQDLLLVLSEQGELALVCEPSGSDACWGAGPRSGGSSGRATMRRRVASRRGSVL